MRLNLHYSHKQNFLEVSQTSAVALQQGCLQGKDFLLHSALFRPQAVGQFCTQQYQRHEETRVISAEQHRDGQGWSTGPLRTGWKAQGFSLKMWVEKPELFLYVLHYDSCTNYSILGPAILKKLRKCLFVHA